MKALILARWVAMRWGREPWKWVVLAFLAAVWPSIHLLAPFGENPLKGHAQALNYELAFVAAGIGAACSLDALEVLPTCAHPLGLRASWGLEWCALIAGALTAEAATLALPLAVMIGDGVRVGLGLVLHVGFCSAYLAALGLVLLRVKLPAGSRAWLLLAMTWALPVLSLSPSAPANLDAGVHPTFGSGSTPNLIAIQIASISALLLGVYLMDARRWRHA